MKLSLKKATHWPQPWPSGGDWDMADPKSRPQEKYSLDIGCHTGFPKASPLSSKAKASSHVPTEGSLMAGASTELPLLVQLSPPLWFFSVHHCWLNLQNWETMDGKSILMMLGEEVTNVGKCSQYKGSYKTMQTFVLIFKTLHYMKKNDWKNICQNILPEISCRQDRE